ncbi:MAG TPA: NAD-dependent epimerase/dehydratase family protein [Mycobacteriales bacterium]|jgi:nucleoside-diphosphate-sugar epimerase|nr:NAD-dependent epimerase/dehydratase family protein [Mycobacteriales bacterium]
MRAVFVTGGAGFVGGAVLDALAERGETVRALVHTDDAARVVAARGAIPVRGDLCDLDALSTGMRGAEVVVHAASRLRGGWSALDALRRINVDGSRTVLQAARTAGVPRLVLLSTEQVVLGVRPLVGADESAPYPERYVGAYAASKAEAEQLVLAASTPELATVAVRPRMLWGPGDAWLLPRLVTAARSGRLRWVDGGEHLTSTTHVRNAVEGVLAAADRGRSGAAYFVTDGAPLPFREFATGLLATRGIVPHVGSVRGRVARAAGGGTGALWRALPLPGGPPVDLATIRAIGEECTLRDDLARRELGYEGHVRREQGLAELRSEYKYSPAAAPQRGSQRGE